MDGATYLAYIKQQNKTSSDEDSESDAEFDDTYEESLPTFPEQKNCYWTNRCRFLDNRLKECGYDSDAFNRSIDGGTNRRKTRNCSFLDDKAKESSFRRVEHEEMKADIMLERESRELEKHSHSTASPSDDPDKPSK